MVGTDVPIPRALLCGTRGDRVGLLAQALAAQGIVATLAFDGRHVLAILESEGFDLVSVDRSLGAPLADELAPLLTDVATPVMVVGGSTADGPSALDDLVDLAVQPGATPREITMAAVALLARSSVGRRPARLRHATFEVDVSRQEVRYRGQPLDVTKYQLRLLSALVAHRGAVVSRRKLDQLVFETPAVDNGERVAAHVRRIRKKIERDPSRPEVLLTVRGSGYRLAG